MRAIILLLAGALCFATANAQVPHQINYQGYLTNPGGTPVNAPVQMTLKLYNVSTGGSALHIETQTVPVANGVYNVAIGSATPLTLPFDVPYYLGVTVGADAEMTPRQAVLSSPYALRAAAVDPSSPALTGAYFRQGGNAFGADATIGTTDNMPLAVVVNGFRAMRFEPHSNGAANIVGGHANNNAYAGAIGQTVAGGGASGNNCFDAVTESNTKSCANVVSAPYAAVVGGTANLADSWAFVGGGAENSALGPVAAIGGGQGNVASGNGAMVPGGWRNLASGKNSFAAGSRARTQTAGQSPVVHHGAFVFADYNNGTNTAAFYTTAPNEFAARATGGVRFVTAIDGNGDPSRTFQIGSNGTVTAEIETGEPNLRLYQQGGGGYARLRLALPGTWNYWDIAGGGPSNQINFYRGDLGDIMTLTPSSATNLLWLFNGARLTTGGTWTNGSDRNAKENFASVDARDILARVAALPVTQWNYKAEPGVKRIGPMAQDFHAAFGLGHDDTGISTVDEGGVALAAIQGLNAKLEAQATQLAQLQAGRDADRLEIAELRQALVTLLARTTLDSRLAQAR